MKTVKNDIPSPRKPIERIPDSIKKKNNINNKAYKIVIKKNDNNTVNTNTTTNKNEIIVITILLKTNTNNNYKKTHLFINKCLAYKRILDGLKWPFDPLEL